jgi:phosphoribosylanthranilate isomerase
MTHDEVVKVLARVQMDDNRQVDRVVVNSWVEEIGDLEFQEALEAVVMHRRETTQWLMAAHVRENVRRIRYMRARDERVANPRQIEPPKITLDRAEFDRLTQLAIQQARTEGLHSREIN